MINLSQCIFIVEGKTDADKLKAIYPEIMTFQTDGLAINNVKINQIKQLAVNKQIVCFFDPDIAGQKIRNCLINIFPNALHCFISKQDIIKSKGKIGIAEATNESIIRAISNVISLNHNDSKKNSLTYNEYLDLDLMHKNKRLIICNKLNIPFFNFKQLFKVLNFMNINKKQVLDWLEDEKD